MLDNTKESLTTFILSDLLCLRFACYHSFDDSFFVFRENLVNKEHLVLLVIVDLLDLWDPLDLLDLLERLEERSELHNNKNGCKSVASHIQTVLSSYCHINQNPSFCVSGYTWIRWTSWKRRSYWSQGERLQVHKDLEPVL